MIYAILAAIQEIEPTAIPLMAIMLSSVAMYAIGILLPCGKCCGCDPCPKCFGECLSVTLQGFSGSGTTAGTTACDCSAINGTYTLTRGPGYEPQLIPRITATTGSGAEITADLEFRQEDGTWTLADASVLKRGSGYSADAAFAYELYGAQVGCNKPPIVSVTRGRGEPTVSVQVADAVSPVGSGATFVTTMEQSSAAQGAETWRIKKVTQTNRYAGSGYDPFAAVTFAPTGTTVQVSPATGVAIPEQLSPAAIGNTLWFYFYFQPDSGTLGPVSRSFYWQPASPHPSGLTHYTLCINLLWGGYGHTSGGKIILETSNLPVYQGTQLLSPNTKYVIGGYSVQNGTVTSISYNEFPVWRPSSRIDSIKMTDGGEYYAEGGIADLEIVDGGRFFPTDGCQYSYCDPVTCPTTQPKCRSVSVSVGQTTTALQVKVGNAVVATGIVPNADHPCDDLVFEAAEFTSTCATKGTAEGTVAECGEPPGAGKCCAPPCSGCSPIGAEYVWPVKWEFAGRTVEFTMRYMGGSYGTSWYGSSGRPACGSEKGYACDCLLACKNGGWSFTAVAYTFKYVYTSNIPDLPVQQIECTYGNYNEHAAITRPWGRDPRRCHPAPAVYIADGDASPTDGNLTPTNWRAGRGCTVASGQLPGVGKCTIGEPYLP